MESRKVARQARRADPIFSRVAECRHMLESCSHKIRTAGRCGRYAVSGGRAGDPAWSLM